MPKHVLLIDDDQSIAAALSIRLRYAGYEVTVALDGQRGLVEAARNQPDAIVLDIRLPGIDGYEVCRRLKGAPETVNIPVIFMSANATEGTRRQAIEAGGVAFHAKPYEPTEIINTLESITDLPGRRHGIHFD